VAVARKDIKVGMVVAEVKMAAEGQSVVKVEMSTVKVEMMV
jgi:hypothetical protein